MTAGERAGRTWRVSRPQPRGSGKNRVLRVLRLTLARVRFLYGRYLQSDRAFIRTSYRRAFGVDPDLANPGTLNEKIQWRKLHDRNPMYPFCTDKYRVRTYVRDRVGEDYLVPLILATSTITEVDFESLPDRFVMKANHGSGWNELVWDKHQLERRRAIRTARRWLRSNFYARYREWQYKDIEPLILIEELLADEAGALPAEYRFFCFDGQARFVEVVTGRFGPALKVDYYDMDWVHIPVTHDIYENAVGLPRPACLDEMVAVAQKLSREFSFVRVDLYLAGDRPYFGELTFTPSAGLLRFHPPEYDRIFGEGWPLTRERQAAGR